MRKLYTQRDYAGLAVQANIEHKIIEKYTTEIEYEVTIPEYEKKTIEVPVINPETGELTGEYETIEVDDYNKPIMIEEENEDGNIILVPKTHTETRTEIVEGIRLIDNPNENLKMTPLDFLKALEAVGIDYTTIKQIMSTNPTVERELMYCQFVYRKHPMIEQFAEQYNISSEQLDYIFKKANREVK